jgi:hypothetical protein
MFRRLVLISANFSAREVHLSLLFSAKKDNDFGHVRYDTV